MIKFGGFHLKELIFGIFFHLNFSPRFLNTCQIITNHAGVTQGSVLGPLFFAMTKYLGLVVDEKLNWSKHINKLYNKLTPMIGALYRCNAYLTESNRYFIYNVYLLSNFRYLITIWGVCSKSSFKRAQVC